MVVFRADSFWLRMASAIFLAFAFMRCGIVFHDACHASIFRSRRINQAVRLLLGNVAIGISAGWWTWEHNAHHARPNVIGVDPDIAVPHLVFSEEQRAARGRAARAFARIQAPLFVPLWSIQSIYFTRGIAPLSLPASRAPQRAGNAARPGPFRRVRSIGGRHITRLGIGGLRDAPPGGIRGFCRKHFRARPQRYADAGD